MVGQSTEHIADNPFDGWTTIEEAAEMIGRGNATVRGWANKGWIRCYSVGRKVRLVNIKEVTDCAQVRRPLKRG